MDPKALGELCQDAIEIREKTVCETFKKPVEQPKENELFNEIVVDDVPWNRECKMEVTWKEPDDEEQYLEQQHSPQNEHVVTISPETVFMCQNLESEAAEKRAQVWERQLHIQSQRSKKTKTTDCKTLRIKNEAQVKNYEVDIDTDDESLPFSQNEEHFSLPALRSDEQNVINIHCSKEFDKKRRSKLTLILDRGDQEKRVRRDGERKQRGSLTSEAPARKIRICLGGPTPEDEKRLKADAKTKKRKQRADEMSEQREKQRLHENEKQRQQRELRQLRRANEASEGREKPQDLSSTSEREKPEIVSESSGTDQGKKGKRTTPRRNNNAEEYIRKKARETPEKREKRLQYLAEYRKKQKVRETSEEREKRRKYYSEYAKKQQEGESPEEREKRLKEFAEYMRNRLAGETPEQREKRSQANIEYKRKKRAGESPEERARRLEAVAENARRLRATATPEERERRRKAEAEYKRKKRDREMPERRRRLQKTEKASVKPEVNNVGLGNSEEDLGILKVTKIEEIQ